MTPIRVLAIAIMTATPAAAQSKPTAVLFDGLLQYQPALLRPLAPLAGDLERQGWRVIHDTHLGAFSADEEPVLLVGHSAGGAKALEFAKRQAELARYQPIVITLDAAPWWHGVYRCHVKVCINLHTPTYPKIAGARNVSVNGSHVGIATDRTIRTIILRQAAPLLRAR